MGMLLLKMMREYLQNSSSRSTKLLQVIILSILLDFTDGNALVLTPSPYKAHERLPLMISTAKKFRVPEKQSVQLPCEVENLGDHVVVWRKGHEVLSAGNVLATRDTRFKLRKVQDRKDNNKLELVDIQPQDAGDYSCQISTIGQPLEVTHTVEVLVPPRVKAKPFDGKIVVKKGLEVTLECIASGNPVPNVVWSREHDLLPEGSISGQNSHGYTIRQVSRYDAGRYTCTADNGVGSPAQAFIDLDVLYEPEIDVESEKVHSGLGKEAHLTCIVHGEPKPTVRWFKESTELSTSAKIRMDHNRGTSNRNTLIIRGLSSKEDFGNYSCVAENSLGSSKRHIEVHGRPTPAVFRNKPHQGGRDSFQLTWTVDSYTRIEEYRLLYRQIKPYHPSDTIEFGLNMISQNDQNGGGMSSINTLSSNDGVGSDWTNIIIPGDFTHSQGSEFFSHEKKFLLTDLKPDSQYECLVQAKNRYGWSEASRIHRFYTHSTFSSRSEPAARDMSWTGQNASAAISSQKFLLCFILISSILLRFTSSHF